MIGKDAGRKLKLEKKITLHQIDPIRVIKEGRGLVARTAVLVTTADAILMRVRGFFTSGFKFWGLCLREQRRRRSAFHHLCCFFATADVGYEFAVLRRTWMNFPSLPPAESIVCRL